MGGNTTTIEAVVYAQPADSVEVQWYHESDLIDTENQTLSGYAIDVDGETHKLIIDSVTEDRLGEYVIVVSVNGSANASDEVVVKILGKGPSSPPPPSSLPSLSLFLLLLLLLLLPLPLHAVASTFHPSFLSHFPLSVQNHLLLT